MPIYTGHITTIFQKPASSRQNFSHNLVHIMLRKTSHQTQPPINPHWTKKYKNHDGMLFPFDGKHSWPILNCNESKLPCYTIATNAIIYIQWKKSKEKTEKEFHGSSIPTAIKSTETIN